MHRSRIACIIIDCQSDDLSDHAAFWSAALGYPVSEKQPDPKYTCLQTADHEPRVILQKVDHPSRIHLDIETNDIEAEAQRLEGLGARRVDALKGWVVMEAPSGHRFCIVKPQRPDFMENARVWEAEA